MKSIIMLGLVGLFTICPGLAASAEGTSARLFACLIGEKRVAVTSAGGQLTYHYGTANKDEISIVGIPESGNVFQMTQRFAGMEYQLRFRSGDFSYIVYSSEGNGRVGAAAASGLIVMRGTKQLSDKSCARFAELAMPADSLKIPEDADAYSAM